ncbi:hypothetical protein, partial [Enterococcus faecium]
GWVGNVSRVYHIPDPMFQTKTLFSVMSIAPMIKAKSIGVPPSRPFISRRILSWPEWLKQIHAP